MSESETNESNPSPQTCPYCGQTQLGKVNRCWKCSAYLVQAPVGTRDQFGNAPPVLEAILIDVELAEPNAQESVTPEKNRSEQSEPAEFQNPISDSTIATSTDTDTSNQIQGPYQNPQNSALLDANVVGANLEGKNLVNSSTTENVATGSFAAPNVHPQTAPDVPPQFSSPMGTVRSAPPQPSTLGNNPFLQLDHQPPVPEPLWMPGYEHFSARGGAVAALLLGVMSIFGGYFTIAAVLNGLLGIILGLWGTQSTFKRVAWTGIGLSLTGIVSTGFFFVFRLSS